MLISYWSSDVCSSDLVDPAQRIRQPVLVIGAARRMHIVNGSLRVIDLARLDDAVHDQVEGAQIFTVVIEIDHGDADVLRARLRQAVDQRVHARSEEHTSELQSLMRLSYDVFS